MNPTSDRIAPSREARLSPRWSLLGALLLVAVPGTSPAQTNPAVSEVNGKVSYAGGNMNSAEGHNFDGSLTLPLTHALGFQLDGLYSRISDLDFGGGAGHFFWRDPDLGLVGLTGGYLYRSGVQTWQIGTEGEYYAGRFTFGLFVGAGSLRYDQAVPFISTDPTRFVGRLSVGYYPLDNLRVGISGLTAFNEKLIKGEVEYQTPLRGLALTGEVAKGDHGYDHWLLGVRYYFGANKSLISRHRQDDPPGLMQQVLVGLGLYGADYNRKANDYGRDNPGTGGSGDQYGSVTYSAGYLP